MAADFSWEGDVLKVSGTSNDDFIAIQTSQMGTHVVTDDVFVSEFQGRSIDSASSVEIFGGGGNDILLSYQSPVPVSLMGEDGDDFLFSDNLSDGLDGGEGSDWVYGQDVGEIIQNAFGIEGLDLDPSSIHGIPQIDENNFVRLAVEVEGQTEISGMPVDLSGVVDVAQSGIDVELGGTVPVWDNAFGIPEFNLTNTHLSFGVDHEFEAGNGYRVALESSLDISGTEIDIEGVVDLSEESVAAEFAATVNDWDNAFGINGWDLEDATLRGSGSIDAEDNVELDMEIDADMRIGSALLDVSGEVSLSPSHLEGQLSTEVHNWDDAFGIEGLALTQGDVAIRAYTDRAEDQRLHLNVDAEMEIEGKEIGIAGEIELSPEQIDATLIGSVDQWDDAFGIDGLDLNDTEIEVIASSNRQDVSDLQLNLWTDVEVTGSEVSVEGTITFDEQGIETILTGEVDGQWAAALGVAGLNLHDTAVRVRAAKTESGSELEIDVSSSMDLWGTTVFVDGGVEVTPNGTNAHLTGAIEGDWNGAFGIDALQLRDTGLTIATDADGASISIDTDLQLFGGYIDVIGDIDLGSDGPTISFSPPGSYDFVDLLGIPEFTLEDADLGITAGLDGVHVAIDTTMNMGAIDVGFTGAFAVGRDNVSASLTGRVDRWDDAFDVAGLDLEDIVLTLGAESGPAGASMFIGLGAGIHIGTTQIDVAGLVGVGSTGWEVAFRGEINSLTSDDLVDFANTLTQASDPNANEIPEDALGDFELKDAYVNFAPHGGNDDLGITDGFGIGGEFYNDGELLADGEFEVDLESFSFQVALEIPELDLGLIDLSDVVIDIQIASSESYFKVAGTAELMGSEVSVAGEIYSDGTFMVTGTADLDIAAMSATATFTIDKSGIFFEASAEVSVVNAILSSVTGEVLEVANNVQDVIDDAQAAVDSAKDGLRVLEADLEDARAEAQREVDEIKDKIDSAKSVVDSIGRSKDYWYRVRKSRYSAWKSAVRKTKSVPWYKVPYYKGVEASKYVSYLAAAGTYTTRVVAYNSAKVTYNSVRAAAGWALDTAGVEANPEVIRLKALLATAKVGLAAAELVLDGVEEVNADAIRMLEIANSLQVDRITLSGRVETKGSASVNAKVDYSFSGKQYSFAMEADTDKLVEQLAGRLAAAIL